MSLRELPYKALCNNVTGLLVEKFFRNSIPSRGLRICTTDSAITPEIKASLLFGMYEPDEVRLVKSFARTDLDVIDVGSSLGVIASHIGRRLGPGRRLICVEANATLLDHLRNNVRSNAPSCDFTVVHAAIHYEATRPVVFRSGATNIDGTVENLAPATDEPGVRPLTLDALVNDFSIKRYLLLCDIEGSEAGIILDDPSLKSCEQLIIELHPTTYKGRRYTIEMLADALQAHGFHLRIRWHNVFLFDRVPEKNHNRRSLSLSDVPPRTQSRKHS